MASRWVIAGGSGFLGRALCDELIRAGYLVTRLVRRVPEARDESVWDPATGMVDPEVLARADVVVNLCGASVGRLPWTSAYRQTLRQSRIQTTRTLAEALAGLADPAVFLVQSATGRYGRDRGAEELDEDASPGVGFLADLVRDWEAAADPAREAGLRVVHLRTGLVLDGRAPAFRLMALPFRLGVGGPVGSGRQWMPMVTLPDWLAAVRFVASRASCRGVYNVVLPQPPTNREFATAMGAALRRPVKLALPAPAVRLATGEFASELLGSRRVLPARLRSAGFEFAAPDVESVVRTAVRTR